MKTGNAHRPGSQDVEGESKHQCDYSHSSAPSHKKLPTLERLSPYVYTPARRPLLFLPTASQAPASCPQLLTVAVEAREALKGIAQLRRKALSGVVQVAQWGDWPATR